MSKTILFIHGMFQNPKSWEDWETDFRARGHNTVAPAWPFHGGEPAALRKDIPPGLGKLSLQTIVDQYAHLVGTMNDKPIVVGHSVGGLVTQILASRGLVAAGACVDSVAPNRMLAFDWGFFKNDVAIANPVAGDDPFLMTAKGFQASFANTLSEEASNRAYERTATHDSRNVLRDCMGDPGKINLDRPTLRCCSLPPRRTRSSRPS